MEDLNKSAGKNDTFRYDLSPAEFDKAMLDIKNSKAGKEMTSSDPNKLKTTSPPNSQEDRLWLNNWSKRDD